MRKIIALTAAIALASIVPIQAQTNLPGTNTPLTGCVEGRAVRIVNGMPACSTTVAPVLTGCGTGASMSANATDNVGQITTGTGIVTSCVMKMSKLYSSPSFGCIGQTNSTTSLIAGSPVVGTDGTVTTVTFSLVLSLASGKITYNCFPV